MAPDWPEPTDQTVARARFMSKQNGWLSQIFRLARLVDFVIIWSLRSHLSFGALLSQIPKQIWEARQRSSPKRFTLGTAFRPDERL